MIHITAQEVYKHLHFERLFSAVVQHYCTLLSVRLVITLYNYSDFFEKLKYSLNVCGKVESLNIRSLIDFYNAILVHFRLAFYLPGDDLQDIATFSLQAAVFTAWR